MAPWILLLAIVLVYTGFVGLNKSKVLLWKKNCLKRDTQTIEFLTELGETLVEKVLTLEDSNRIATGLLITISVNNLRALLYLIIAGKFLNMW